MNMNDETLFSTINEPQMPQFENNQYAENEMPEEQVNNKKNAAGIAAAVAGSVAVGGLGAWGLYSYLNHGNSEEQIANLHDTAQNETEPEPVLAANTVNHVTHIETVEPKISAPVNEVEYVQLIETEVDGQTVIVGMQYDAKGHRVLLIDADHDGQFDIRAVDVNDDGEFAQIVDLHEDGSEPMMVADFQQHLEDNGIEPMYTWNPDDDIDSGSISGNLELAGMNQITDDDGNIINVATVRVAGQDVMLIDPDNDGQFEYVAADLNHNGHFEDNEFDELDQPIALNDVQQLPHSDDFTGEYIVDDGYAAYDDVATDDSLLYASDDIDSDGEVIDADSVDGNDDVIVVESEDYNADVIEVSEPDDEMPAFDSVDDSMGYVEPESSSDDFGTMGDEGINI